MCQLPSPFIPSLLLDHLIIKLGENNVHRASPLHQARFCSDLNVSANSCKGKLADLLQDSEQILRKIIFLFITPLCFLFSKHRQKAKMQQSSGGRVGTKVKTEYIGGKKLKCVPERRFWKVLLAHCYQHPDNARKREDMIACLLPSQSCNIKKRHVHHLKNGGLSQVQEFLKASITHFLLWFPPQLGHFKDISSFLVHALCDLHPFLHALPNRKCLIYPLKLKLCKRIYFQLSCS